MFSRHSPLKRKHKEYHDPDYPQHAPNHQLEQNQDEDDDKPGCSTQFLSKRIRRNENINVESGSQKEKCFIKVRQVIETEFQKEIEIKKQTLEEIDERLEKAKHLLDRLRYSIVSAYYKKQEIPLTAADAASLKSPYCLFEREDKGPQMPLHPSLKKLLGKRPKNLSDVIRSCPKRTAARNAVQTIRSKSQVQKREERKLRQLIRKEGIVIDHSKQNINENDVSSMLTAAAQKSLSGNQEPSVVGVKQEKVLHESTPIPSGKSLNAARLNNKIRHLIVVGNTSKYIGNELEKDVKFQTQNLTHKWLVYVQAKESKQPIESFIKKVRFHLHHSYRPNDVVDIEAPPFQVSRRGWGEFPIRVQLFFHPEFHQKPVQLVHNIILDQTLTGIQTLGAETVLEIWLREVKSLNTENEEKTPEVIQKAETPSQQKTNLMTRNEELVDDNLLEFLNKIEASPFSISADIEKIQPTVVVTEPLGVKLKTPSPEKSKIFTNIKQRSPIKMTSLDDMQKLSEKHLTITSLNSNTLVTTKNPDKHLDIALITTKSSLETPRISDKSLAITPATTINSSEKSAICEKNLGITPNTTSISLETPSIVTKPSSTIPFISSNKLETSNIFDKSEEITTTVTSNSTTTLIATSAAITTQFKTALFVNNSLTTKPITTFVRLPNNTSQLKCINPSASSANSIPPLRPITPTLIATKTQNQTFAAETTQKPSIILNKDGKILMPAASVASAVRKTILPIVSNASANFSTPTTKISQLTMTSKAQIVSISPSSTSLSAASPNSSANKQILQKKLVQLVDSTGKVKYIQMLVASSSAASNLPNLGTSSAAPKLITMSSSAAKSNAVTNTTQIANTVTTPLLISPNGARLMPVMTTKPNIFKIVPENIQTKPQILTFSTTTALPVNTNTPTTAHTLQKISITTTTTTNTQTVDQIPSTTITSRLNDVALSIANKLQKSKSVNISTAGATKNLVFQKEGKLYIIDPQQMKYKQQQKKQVSLLKPQISLLKQQQQQQKCFMPASATTNDSTVDNKPKTATQLSNGIISTSCVHLGLKQQRITSINELQLLQMKRVLFEKQFLRQEFTNVCSAVEFLLRRLKLVASKDSLVSAFPFVCHSLPEFHSLTAFKQRAFEWLRAKTISRLLRSHKDLQRHINISKERFWSTKEVATFARQYAYTPPIKSLPRPDRQQKSDSSNTNDFVNLVKSELKQEQNLQYDTLTDHHKVRNWVEGVWHTLEDYEYQEDQHQIIDIDGIQEEEKKIDRKFHVAASSATATLPISSSSLDIYLPPPPQLENQCQLVSDICKDFNIKLVHEELDTKLYHPCTQTILAQCLHLFIEKIIRQSIALKQENTVTNSAIESICTLKPQDIAKVLATNNDFDFLTNKNFGSAILASSSESPIKQQKS